MTPLLTLLLQLLLGVAGFHPTPLVDVPQLSGVVYQCTTPAADVCTIPPLTLPGEVLP